MWFVVLIYLFLFSCTFLLLILQNDKLLFQGNSIRDGSKIPAETGLGEEEKISYFWAKTYEV